MLAGCGKADSVNASLLAFYALVPKAVQAGYYARIAYSVYQPRAFIAPGYQGTLGYGFPTARGVAVGNPTRAVVSINGDGGFGCGMQELSTARKHDLNVAIVVFNDGFFGSVRKKQQDQFGKEFDVELLNPDFGKPADAFFIPYRRVYEPPKLEAALRATVLC